MLTGGEKEKTRNCYGLNCNVLDRFIYLKQWYPFGSAIGWLWHLYNKGLNKTEEGHWGSLKDILISISTVTLCSMIHQDMKRSGLMLPPQQVKLSKLLCFPCQGGLYQWKPWTKLNLFPLHSPFVGCYINYLSHSYDKIPDNSNLRN